MIKKKFNTTGVCRPTKHYMADVSTKLAQTLNMVELGEYFVINRPRQYGKTTILHALADILRKSGEYIVFSISFEGISDTSFEREEIFSPNFVRYLAKSIRPYSPETTKELLDIAPSVKNLDELSDFITYFSEKTDKKVVLFIDEVDKSSNNQLFVSFLGMLRNKYLVQDDIKTFHAVVLAGLYDVKTLKLKLRPDDEQKLNSPWNIAADFNVDMNLFPSEIKPMLDEYVMDTAITMDTQWVAERLFYYTSGYPFLVSKLCKTIDEQILPSKAEKTWAFNDIEEAVGRLLKENNTNFDSLIKSLENNRALYDFVYRIIIDGEIVFYNSYEPIILMGIMHGIFKANGQIKIHNRVYEQQLYNYMTAKTMVAMKSSAYNYAGHFTIEDNMLDMPAVLLKFQQFMKEEFNEKDKTFLEKQGRLIFLSFLAPILNGKGQTFKEVQISEEKRLDIVATYFQHKYIIELKRWYGEEYHQKGIAQLTDYLDAQGVQKGFLVIFEYNKVKSWRKEWITNGEKSIFAVWV